MQLALAPCSEQRSQQMALARRAVLQLGRPHSLLIQLNWPGRTPGDDTDGLVCVDADGCVTAANQTARQMVPQLSMAAFTACPGLHCKELFALPFEALFDAARRNKFGDAEPLEVPLWSGLRLHAVALTPGHTSPPTARKGKTADERMPLKAMEISLIRKAVDDAKGNVMQAARALGISRATVYRKLGNKKNPIALSNIAQSAINSIATFRPRGQ